MILEGDDELIWAFAKHGNYAPKIGYIVLLDPLKPVAPKSWWNLLWKLKAGPR